MKGFKKLGSLILAAALALGSAGAVSPAATVSAASKSQNAKAAYEYYVGQRNIDEINKGNMVLYTWGYFDINGDKTPEMFLFTSAKTIEVYTYTSDIKKLKTVKNLSDIRKSGKSVIVTTKKSKVTTITKYTLSKAKLKAGTTYKYNAKKKLYYKNGKKIKKAAYTKYLKAVKKKKKIEPSKMDDNAFNAYSLKYAPDAINYALDTIGWKNVFFGDNDLSEYIIKVIDTRDEKEKTAAELSLKRGTVPENAVIGKFDAGDMKILPSETVTDIVTDYETLSTTYKTEIAPEDIEKVLPGFKPEEGEDISKYHVFGEYAITYDEYFNPAIEISFNYYKEPKEGEYYTGLLMPFAKYTFEKKYNEAVEKYAETDAFSFNDINFEESQINDESGEVVKYQVKWEPVEGVSRYLIRYAFNYDDTNPVGTTFIYKEQTDTTFEVEVPKDAKNFNYQIRMIGMVDGKECISDDSSIATSYEVTTQLRFDD